MFILASLQSRTTVKIFFVFVDFVKWRRTDGQLTHVITIGRDCGSNEVCNINLSYRVLTW